MSRIEIIDTITGFELHLEDLTELLFQAVNAGGAIGFIAPFSRFDAKQFWTNSVLPLVESASTILFVVRSDNKTVGTVQLHIQMPPNQPHRCEVAKLIVHPDHRNQGHAKALMTALEHKAGNLNKTLITLDTRTGDNAEKLYKSLGYQSAGIIPDYALNPTDNKLHATTCMFRLI